MEDIPDEWIVSKEEWKYAMEEFLEENMKIIKKHIDEVYFKEDDITDCYFDMINVEEDFSFFMENFESYKKGLRYREKHAIFFITDDGTPGYVFKDEGYKKTKPKDLAYR